MKYIIEGKSLWRWCKENGKTETNYKYYVYLMKEKCMTLEQALVYKRPPAEIDQHARKLRNSRRFYGWTDEEIALNLSPTEGKRHDAIKRAVILYKGKTLNEVAKEYGISRSCIWYRVFKQGMSIKEAIKEAISYRSRVKNYI